MSISNPAVHRPKRWPWLAAALALIVGASATGAWALSREDHGPKDTRPVVLPDTLGGLPISRYNDLEPGGLWYQNNLPVFGPDHAFGGRAYTAYDSAGSPIPPGMNLIVARGHFERAADLERAAKPYTRHGEVTCTNNIDTKIDGTGVQRMDNMMVCWRISDSLTVSVFGLGGQQTPEPLVAAVNEAWALQG